jgi:hypothetical protein
LARADAAITLGFTEVSSLKSVRANSSPI